MKWELLRGFQFWLFGKVREIPSVWQIPSKDRWSVVAWTRFRINISDRITNLFLFPKLINAGCEINKRCNNEENYSLSSPFTLKLFLLKKTLHYNLNQNNDEEKQCHVPNTQKKVVANKFLDNLLDFPIFCLLVYAERCECSFSCSLPKSVKGVN